MPALLAEADRARAARDADDRAYWRRTGEDGSEAGLTAYLGRYPDGLYAATARERLARDRRRAATPPPTAPPGTGRGAATR